MQVHSWQLKESTLLGRYEDQGCLCYSILISPHEMGKKNTWIQTKPNTTGSHIPPLPNSTFKNKTQTTAAKVHLLVAWARSEWDLVVSQVDPPDLGATHWCANAHRPVAILARNWNNCNPWRVCQGRSKAQGEKWMAIMAFFLHDAKGSIPKGKIEVIWIFSTAVF